MKTENIITIDFDIIMAPSIELYNKYITEFYGVNDFAKDYNGLISYSNADLDIYNIITSYLIDSFLTLNNDNIYFINDHEQVYDLLEINKKYNIYNIDHHHDCGYVEEQKDLFCGNWIKILKKENRLNEYTWITDESTIDEIDKNIGKKVFFYDTDLFSLPKPDKLIICASFEWIPFQFRPLFYLWLQLYNQFSGDSLKEIIRNPRRNEIEKK